jgi:flagellar biosynthesis/type III secretory pathway protein FliH
MPDLKDGIPNDKQVSSLLGKPAKWYSQDKKQIAPKKEVAKALTLDDVEAIRQSAYDDGFNEGNEAGFAQGLASSVAKLISWYSTLSSNFSSGQCKRAIKLSH